MLIVGYPVQPPPYHRYHQVQQIRMPVGTLAPASFCHATNSQIGEGT
jgi:hypothetical protein